MGKSGFGEYSGTSVGSAIGLVGLILAAMPLDALGDWTVPDSILFGLLTTTLGVAWDVRKDVRRLSIAKDRATRLLVALESSQMREEPLVTLCEAAGKISGMDIGVFAQGDINAEVVALATRLDGLADNQILRLTGETRLNEYINQFTQDADRRLHATSAVDGTDGTFWASASGRDYLALQKSRIDAGVNIRRIFFTEEMDLPPSAIEWMLQQESMGIEVGAMLDAHGVDDFIVYDDFAVVRTHLLPSGRGVEGGTIIFRSSRIEKASSQYDTWWGRASRTWERVKSDQVDLAVGEASG